MDYGTASQSYVLKVHVVKREDIWNRRFKQKLKQTVELPGENCGTKLKAYDKVVVVACKSSAAYDMFLRKERLFNIYS